MIQLIVYYIKTYSIQVDLSNHMPGPVSIYFLTSKCPVTVWRGELNLQGSCSMQGPYDKSRACMDFTLIQVDAL